MPNNLEGNDAHLVLKDKNNNEFSVLPKENEFIIHRSETDHHPNAALKSTKDRIVLATNLGFRKKNLITI